MKIEGSSRELSLRDFDTVGATFLIIGNALILFGVTQGLSILLAMYFVAASRFTNTRVLRLIHSLDSIHVFIDHSGMRLSSILFHFREVCTPSAYCPPVVEYQGLCAPYTLLWALNWIVE